MISSTLSPSPLRSSLCPRLASPRPLSILRRSSTAQRPAPAANGLLPHQGILLYHLRSHIGNESKLHRLRDALRVPPLPQLPLPAEAAELEKHAATAHVSHGRLDIVEGQLKECKHHADYLALITAVLNTPKSTSTAFKHNTVRLICRRILYGSVLEWPARHADDRMLALTHEIRFKLEDARVPLPDMLLNLGLIGAANCHSFAAMKLYLHLIHTLRQPVPVRVFCAVLDRMISAPARASWLRPWENEHALAAMLGFLDAPAGAAYDLSTLLPRSQWACMQHWLRALAAVNAHHQLRAEWALWLHDPRRKSAEAARRPQQNREWLSRAEIAEREPIRRLRAMGRWNSRTRGDLAFVEAFSAAGCFEEAWSALAASEIPFDVLRLDTRSAMIEHLQFAPRGWLTDDTGTTLLEACVEFLAEIERKLQVEWVWDERAASGRHRPIAESWMHELQDFEDDLVPALSALEADEAEGLSSNPPPV